MELLTALVAAGSIAVSAANGPSEVSTICIDAATGKVLSSGNAAEVRPPASMVKMMLFLLVSEGVEAGEWSWEDPITASRHAEHMGGSQVYLRTGETYPLEHLMQAVAVASANDAAMAIAEGLWGSEDEYLERVNTRAASLGMVDTHFYSVHGLPPDKGTPFDRTTARDMALLARAVVRHSEVLNWTHVREFSFRSGQATEYSTNKLLWRIPECDGLKTGYIKAAGYCVTATAERDGRRVIAVVMGHDSFNGRFRLAQQLIEDGLRTTEQVVAGD